MSKNLLILGSILGLTAVILGAFGAHGLKEILPEKALESYEVGVRYQFYHAFFSILAGNLSLLHEKAKKIIFYTVLTGVVLFSGSIYLLSTSSLLGVNMKIIAFLTPIGGVFLIASWLVLLINFLKMKSK